MDLTYTEAVELVEQTTHGMPIDRRLVVAWAAYLHVNRGLRDPEPFAIAQRMARARWNTKEWMILQTLLEADLPDTERQAVTAVIDHRQRGWIIMAEDFSLELVRRAWKRAVLDQLPAAPDPDRGRMGYGGKAPPVFTATGIRSPEEAWKPHPGDQPPAS